MSDVIIIGAGVIGCASALALTRRGYKTLVLDRLHGPGYGSTSASCAIIRPYYSTVASSALAWESHFYWANWKKFLNLNSNDALARYVDCGCLVMKTSGNDMLASTIAIMREIGCPFEELTREQLIDRLPGVDTASFAPPKRPEDAGFGESTGGQLGGAVFFPQGGYVTDPQLAARNLMQAASAEGAKFRFNCSVAAVLREDDRVSGVQLDQGECLSAPIVVNIAGPHSSVVNEIAGVTGDMQVSTRALRHEVAHVPAPTGMDFEQAGCVVSDNDTAAYFRPETGNHILIGSEDPECDGHDWADPDDFDRDLSEQARILALRAAQRMPELPIPNSVKGVVDLYDVTEDWAPVYDRSSLSGFYMAVGTSGNQFKNAPVVGEMMAELIAQCESGRDHDANPVQFQLKHVDRHIGLDTFSRRRSINRNSSFSVLG